MISDPTYRGGITNEAVWGGIANGRGTMVNTSGNTSRRARFTVVGSTSMLSSALAPDNNNYLGYSNGMLVVWLLDPPLGLSDGSSISCTLLGRCMLTLHNPFPGFLYMQLNPGPGIPPSTEPSWRLEYNVPDMTAQMEQHWWVDHNGDAWVAGGYYFVFYDHQQAMPAECKGKPLCNAVYQAPMNLWPEWWTNYERRAVPKYFATWQHPSSRWIYMIGFEELTHAIQQASYNTGAIPANVQLCIRYHNPPPNWLEFCLGPMESTKLKIEFFQVYVDEQAFPVYTTSSSLTALPQSRPLQGGPFSPGSTPWGPGQSGSTWNNSTGLMPLSRSLPLNLTSYEQSWETLPPMLRNNMRLQGQRYPGPSGTSNPQMRMPPPSLMASLIQSSSCCPYPTPHWSSSQPPPRSNLQPSSRSPAERVAEMRQRLDGLSRQLETLSLNAGSSTPTSGSRGQPSPRSVRRCNQPVRRSMELLLPWEPSSHCAPRSTTEPSTSRTLMPNWNATYQTCSTASSCQPAGSTNSSSTFTLRKHPYEALRRRLDAVYTEFNRQLDEELASWDTQWDGPTEDSDASEEADYASSPSEDDDPYNPYGDDDSIGTYV